MPRANAQPPHIEMLFPVDLLFSCLFLVRLSKNCPIMGRHIGALFVSLALAAPIRGAHD
jgi:hypothetical protein